MGHHGGGRSWRRLGFDLPRGFRDWFRESCFIYKPCVGVRGGSWKHDGCRFRDRLYGWRPCRGDGIANSGNPGAQLPASLTGCVVCIAAPTLARRGSAVRRFDATRRCGWFCTLVCATWIKQSLQGGAPDRRFAGVNNPAFLAGDGVRLIIPTDSLGRVVGRSGEAILGSLSSGRKRGV